MSRWMFCVQWKIENLSTSVGQRSKYSSLEFCVKRSDLLQYFDFQWMLLDFFKLLNSHDIKMDDFRGHQSVLQGWRGCSLSWCRASGHECTATSHEATSALPLHAGRLLLYIFYQSYFEATILQLQSPNMIFLHRREMLLLFCSQFLSLLHAAN